VTAVVVEPRPVAELLELVLRALPTSACVLWPGELTRDGYGRHRLVFETLRGPVPRGLVLDHTCRVRACCNVAHLEPVTQRENVRRGVLARGGRLRSGLGWPVGSGRCS
jgi:hypothetical protein